MDQIKLFDASKSEKLAEENRAYENVKPLLDEIVDSWYLPNEDLSAESNKNNTLLVVKLCGSVVCRYKMNGKQWHIELPKSCQKYVPKDYTGNVKHPKGDYIFVDIEKSTILSDFNNCICMALQDAIDSIPKEFSCCHRYLECSDVGHCIYPNREDSKGCYYKRVMHEGHIFYGKSKTI